MTPTDQRNLAAQLAPDDPERALTVARGIKDPWFARQALAHVAMSCPEGKFEHVIDESFRVFGTADDPYRIVASAAWPVRALVERGRTDTLDAIIPELLNQAEQIELLASRSEALFLLFQAIFPAGLVKWRGVLQALMKASAPLISWRQRRNLRDAVLIVWNENAALAEEMINHIEDGKLKRQIESRIQNSELHLPRRFVS